MNNRLSHSNKLAKKLLIASLVVFALWFLFLVLRFAIFQKSLTVAQGLSKHFLGIRDVFYDFHFFDPIEIAAWKAIGWLAIFLVFTLAICSIMEAISNHKKISILACVSIVLTSVAILEFIANSGDYFYYISKFFGKNALYSLVLIAFLAIGFISFILALAGNFITLQEPRNADLFAQEGLTRLPLRPRRSSRETKVQGLDIIILVILIFYAALIIFPFWNAFVISLSTEEAYLTNNLLLWPYDLDLSSYQKVFADSGLWGGFRITMILLIGGTLYQLFFTVITGYALSRHNWTGKNFVMNMILVTMFFGGGMVPYYYLIKDLGMMNTIWVMIIPGAIDTFNMLLMRNYFASLPVEMEESAKIDGANDIVIFVKIFLPLSLPMLATIGLFFAVGNWNSWYNAMLFIPDKSQIWPLQMVLRNMINKVSSNIENPNVVEDFSQGLTMASIFFTIVPMMCFYPFLQRFFVKGIVVGAIKG